MSEQCDDGGGGDEDYCKNDCQLNVCGDGILCSGDQCGVAAGTMLEECDDGDGIDDNACSNDCLVNCTPGTMTFDYTGTEVEFPVPVGCTTVLIEAWGAQGGDDPPASGGLGGFATGTLTVQSGEVLYLYVGGAGVDGPGTGENCNMVGGFNGGGATGTMCCSNAGGGAGSGGGASDVRVGGRELADRVLVAAGGGGAGSDQAGAVGGGLIGGDGQAYNGVAAGGGTQTAGGQVGGHFDSHECTIGTAGALGLGGIGDGNDGGGGGGGYDGGGGGANNAGGGGGSSYTGGVTGGNTMAGQQTGDGQIILSWSM